MTCTLSTSWLQQAFHARFLTIKNILLFVLPLATLRFKLTSILHTSHVSFLLLCISHIPNNACSATAILRHLHFPCFPPLWPPPWRCPSVVILMDPLKHTLVKPFGLQDLSKSLCIVQDLPEGIHALEPHAASFVSDCHKLCIGPLAPSLPKGPSSQYVLPNTSPLCAVSVTVLKKCLLLGYWKWLVSLQRLVPSG